MLINLQLIYAKIVSCESSEKCLKERKIIDLILLLISIYSQHFRIVKWYFCILLHETFTWNECKTLTIYRVTFYHRRFGFDVCISSIKILIWNIILSPVSPLNRHHHHHHHRNIVYIYRFWKINTQQRHFKTMYFDFEERERELGLSDSEHFNLVVVKWQFTNIYRHFGEILCTRNEYRDRRKTTNIEPWRREREGEMEENVILLFEVNTKYNNTAFAQYLNVFILMRWITLEFHIMKFVYLKFSERKIVIS